MRRLSYLVLVLLALAKPDAADAQLLIQRLPEVGVSAHYHFQIPHEDPKRAFDAELIVKSLSRVKVDGEPCHWLEFVVCGNEDGKPVVHQIHKILMKENSLTKGNSPLDGIKKVWVAGPSLKPFPVSLDFAKSQDGYVFGLYLASAFEKTSPIEEQKKIAYQSGELLCKAGTKAVKSFQDGAERVRATYRYWSHENIPTGLAFAAVDFEYLAGQEVTSTRSFEVTLKKIESGAKSLLPDTE